MLGALRGLVLLAAGALAAQSHAPAALDAALQHAETQRAAYVATFRNVTATETRVTELFDERGRVDKQRTLVSNFLVYQSRFDPAVLSEYRIPLTVDGKPTGRPEQDAIKLFGRLARARSTAEELEVLKEQNVSHRLRVVAWGMTLQPFNVVRADRRGGFEFSLQGTESLDGRAVTVLDYREKTPRRVEPRALSSHFAEPWISWRGRAWLDASDHRLRRWVNEAVVSDKTLPEPGVGWRSECEYTDSAFGILVPRRLVWERYRKSGRKNGPQSLRLAVRLTNTYSDFKRFDVFTVAGRSAHAGAIGRRQREGLDVGARAGHRLGRLPVRDRERPVQRRRPQPVPPRTLEPGGRHRLHRSRTGLRPAAARGSAVSAFDGPHARLPASRGARTCGEW